MQGRHALAHRDESLLRGSLFQHVEELWGQQVSAIKEGTFKVRCAHASYVCKHVRVHVNNAGAQLKL